MSKKQNLPTLPPNAKRHLGIKATNAITNTIIYILLAIITVVWLFPFVCIVLQSFEVGKTGMACVVRRKKLVKNLVSTRKNTCNRKTSMLY